MGTKIKTTQSTYISQYVDVDVDISINDVFDFIDECNADEAAKIAEKISISGPIKYKPATIMEEFALRDLQEVLQYQGPEYIMNILNQNR